MSPSVFASSAAGVCRFAPLFFVIVVVVRSCYHVNEQKREEKSREFRFFLLRFLLRTWLVLQLSSASWCWCDVTCSNWWCSCWWAHTVPCCVCYAADEEKRRGRAVEMEERRRREWEGMKVESWRYTRRSIHTTRTRYRTKWNSEILITYRHWTLLLLLFFRPDDDDLLSSENKENN